MVSMKKTMGTVAAMLMALAASGTEEMMQEALQEWQQQMAAYEEAVKNAEDETAKASIEVPTGRDIAPKLWQAMNGRTGTRKNKKGVANIPTYEFEKSWALPGIVWILEHPQAFTAAFTEEEQAQLTYFGNAIVDSLIRVHYTHPGIGAAVPSLAATSSVREYELLQKIYLRNQHKPARACAALGMSIMLNNPMVSSIEGSEAMARGKRLYYLKQSILLSDKNTRFGSQPITAVAMEQAYFLRHLAIGCIAPRLRVLDTQGTAHNFPTTGKLNLLLFWSPAEATGTNMMRDINRLRTQYPELEICPIMPHAAPEEQQQALEQLGIDFTYVDDAKGTAGITYRVEQLPSAILIDKHSKILYGGLPDMKLQTALETAALTDEQGNRIRKPSVTIKETADAPAIQPGSKPTTPADTAVPGLREMPEF